MKYSFLITSIAAGIIMAGCNNNTAASNKEGSEVHEPHQDEEHENASTTSLTEEQLKSIKISFGAIVKKQLTVSFKANGILRVPNQNKANATAMLGGVIQTIHVQTGNNVRKGQVIATITNHAFIIMQEEYLSASSKTALAQLEYNRQKELQQGNAGTLKTLQAAEAELQMLHSKKASLEHQLALIGINPATLSTKNIQSVLNIQSPISGTISNVLVNIGSHVDANNPIVEIIDNSQLHLDLFVYEKELPKLKAGQTIHFTLTNNPGREYDAGIYAISNTFEQNTKAIAVHAKVKGNKDGLIDGMSITALVSLEKAMVDALPSSAIVSHEGQDYIFIVTDPHSEEEHLEEAGTAEHQHDAAGHHHHEGPHNEKGDHVHKEEGTTFEKILIRKGTTDIGYSEITLLKDIPADSKIVTNGAFFILAKMINHGEGHQH